MVSVSVNLFFMVLFTNTSREKLIVSNTLSGRVSSLIVKWHTLARKWKRCLIVTALWNFGIRSYAMPFSTLGHFEFSKNKRLHCQVYLRSLKKMSPPSQAFWDGQSMGVRPVVCSETIQNGTSTGKTALEPTLCGERLARFQTHSRLLWHLMKSHDTWFCDHWKCNQMQQIYCVGFSESRQHI